MEFKKQLMTFALMPLVVFFSATVSAGTQHPLSESDQWLVYPGGKGPGQGKHVILIAADQEYRSEQSMPMMAGILSRQHGFHCTVLFGLNGDGMVDPTMPVYPRKGEEDAFKSHHIPGLKHLEKADLVIFLTRLLTLPEDQLQHIVQYLDSGKPIIGLRTANHGFRGPLPYSINSRQVRFGELLGGTFLSHHGNWHQDSTRGDIIPEMKEHPILIGVQDIWGPSDVYRTYEGGLRTSRGMHRPRHGPAPYRQKAGRSNESRESAPAGGLVQALENHRGPDCESASIHDGKRQRPPEPGTAPPDHQCHLLGTGNGRPDLGGEQRGIHRHL